jgi:type II secretory pathway component PulM
MKLEPLRKYWAERGPVERELLASIAFFAGSALIVLVLIKPALSAIARLERELPDASGQAARLETLLSEVRALKSRPVATVALDTPAALEQSLAAVGLSAERLVPRSNGAWQATFANVPYAAWSLWLAAAEPALGLHVVAVTAKATSTPGNADIGLEFRSERN